ncbi:hypothetical protein KY319_02750 [Candidatus Woesearchaeota archaeon]|nr:hypothetical protein [Candidatus Woesearchaeota archaeon]
MNKRGQGFSTGRPASALIGIITLLFIFYIIFLPPSERKALLEGENVSDVEGTAGVLLDVAPGRLSFVDKSVFDHHVSNVYLVESRNAVVFARENPFVVSKGLFGEQRKTLVFGVSNLADTDNVILSFQAVEHSGTLLISLNGQLIFESDVKVQNPPPVNLPKGLLRDTNVLEFSAKGGFFSKKQYALADVKVVGDITDVARQMATNTFTVSNTEHDNLESSFLDFFPICDQRAVGILTIELNGKIIYSAVPACDSLNRQDLFAEDLRVGKNTLIFRISSGSYRVEQIRVRTILKPVKAFIDFFNVKSSLYNDVLDKDRQIMFLMEFVDDDVTKRAELNINGRFFAVNQRDAKYERDISSIIREGNNYIEIKPLTELDIVKLQVRAD